MSVAIGSVAAMAAGLVVAELLFRIPRRRARERAATWAARPFLADEQFLARCEVPDDPFAIVAALSARRAVAALATVPPATIHPDDSFSQDLSKLPYWDSLDWLGFVLEVEKQSGYSLRVRGAVAHAAVKSAGGYDKLLVRHLVRAIVVSATADPAAEPFVTPAAPP